jgi:hypothetical protein
MSRRHIRARAGQLQLFALTLLLTQLGRAEAQEAWSRHHAASCRPMWPAGQLFHAVGGPGVMNYPSGFHTVTCELPDTSRGADSAITRIRIYVRDATSSDFFEVYACSGPRDSNAEGACGPPVRTGTEFTGDTVLTLGAQELAALQATDFGYLAIYIPNRSDAVGWSYLKGFIVER